MMLVMMTMMMIVLLIVRHSWRSSGGVTMWAPLPVIIRCCDHLKNTLRRHETADVASTCPEPPRQAFDLSTIRTLLNQPGKGDSCKVGITRSIFRSNLITSTRVSCWSVGVFLFDKFCLRVCRDVDREARKGWHLGGQRLDSRLTYSLMAHLHNCSGQTMTTTMTIVMATVISWRTELIRSGSCVDSSSCCG